MTLTIRDDEIETMAEQLKAATNAASVEDVVRQALREALAKTEAEPRPKTPEEKGAFLDALRARLKAEGHKRVPFDMKSFSDELWGDV